MTAVSLKSLVVAVSLDARNSQYAISSLSFTGPLLPLFFHGWTKWPYRFYKCKHDHYVVTGMENWYLLEFSSLISELTDLCLLSWFLNVRLCSNCSCAVLGVFTAVLLFDPSWCLILSHSVFCFFLARLMVITYIIFLLVFHNKIYNFSRCHCPHPYICSVSLCCLHSS